MRLRLLLVLALAAAALPRPVVAAGPLDAPGTPVWPGLTHHHFTAPLHRGQAVGNLLRFSARDPHLRLRSVLSRDAVPGLESVPSMARRSLPEGAVAGTNGGFWLYNPVGDPNGYLAIDGRLVSEPQTQGGGPRGTFALRADGAPLFDRVDAAMTLLAGTVETPVEGVNRYHHGGQPHPDDPDALVYVYSAAFGATAVVQEGLGDALAFTVPGMHVPASGAAAGAVGEVISGPGMVAVPDDGSLVVAYGAAAQRLRRVREGAPVVLDIRLIPHDETRVPDWAAVVSGLAVGPLILKNGRMTDPRGWYDEGFAPDVHSDVRHPRSALGRTAQDELLLLTVDGRQPGYSAGVTLAELAGLLQSLGAVDAISLDGGGSAQFTIDGILRNRPCCDKPVRAVSNGLFVFHDYEFTATTRIQGDSAAATAAAAAVAAYPDAAEEVLLASAADFPDTLAGGPLAARLGAPLLLTGRDALPDATAQALALFGPRRVTVLGGPSAVSEELVAQLRTRYEVGRLAGAGRVETAAAIARVLGEAHPRVVLAAAGDFPDALSATVPAALLGLPILLTARDKLPAATRDVLAAVGTVEAVVVGGHAVVGDAVETELAALGITPTRLAGPSRYATARAVNEWAAGQVAELDETGLVVARGTAFTDALAGGVLGAARRHLLQIVPASDVDADSVAAQYLQQRAAGSLEAVTLVGGHEALSSYQQWQLDQYARR